MHSRRGSARCRDTHIHTRFTYTHAPVKQGRTLVCCYCCALKMCAHKLNSILLYTIIIVWRQTHIGKQFAQKQYRPCLVCCFLPGLFFVWFFPSLELLNEPRASGVAHDVFEWFDHHLHPFARTFCEPPTLPCWGWRYHPV